MKPSQPIYVAVHANGFPLVTQHGMAGSTLRRQAVNHARAFWGLAYEHARKAKQFKIVKYAEQRKDA